MSADFDNTRAFELPNINDYSDEQLEIEYLPLIGNYLIVGGPGTGKSVLALSRSRLLAKKHERDSKLVYKFLVHNKMLSHSSEQLYPECNNDTWLSWFWKLFIQEFGINPKHYSNSNNSYTLHWDNISKLLDCRRRIKNLEDSLNNPFDFDSFFSQSDSSSELHKTYNDLLLSTSELLGEPQINYAKHIFKYIVKSIINKKSILSLENSYLVIDEGQDMPQKFYEFLLGLGCLNIFIAADQNQQITPENNSDIHELMDVIDVSEPKDLTENFRQANGGYYVALLAEQFYCDEATPKSKLPRKSESIEMPLLIDYDQQKRPFNKICQQIINSYQLMPNKLVGIFTSDNEIRLKYYETLKAMIDKEDNEIILSTYFHQKNKKNMSDIRFDKGGIMVINGKSCKGLEFDRVYIADINKFKVEENSDITKKLFYVMTSRSREKLIMLRDTSDVACPVIDSAIIPIDENILKRNRIPVS